MIDDTLERNIALAILDTEIDKKKISEVIKLSKLDKFLNSERKNDILGERGLSVSGGEKKNRYSQDFIMIDQYIYLMKPQTLWMNQRKKFLKILNCISRIK